MNFGDTSKNSKILNFGDTSKNSKILPTEKVHFGNINLSKIYKCNAKVLDKQ